MTQPFVIYALPRSRTAWTAAYLSYGGWTCGHEEIRHARSLEDVKNWLNLPMTGSAETAAAPWWRLVQKMRPDIKTLIIRRPVDQVVDSLMRTGVKFDEAVLWRNMRFLDAKLDQIECRVPGALSVAFDDLTKDEVRARVFEYCLPLNYDAVWDDAMNPVMIEINFPAMMRYYQANVEQLAKLARAAKQKILDDFMRKPVISQSFTFQLETVDDVLRDGESVLNEHAILVGENPEIARTTKNFDLMRKLESMGLLQVTTARSNGKMFGYLMAIINPSLADPGKQEACHTSFCTSRDAPGLGLKLQRASVEQLRQRGVDQVVLRTGTRGLGPRMGVMYRRMGAELFGELYTLDLQNAT